MNGVINHPPRSYYVEFREDYVQICSSIPKRSGKSKSSSHCQALILAIMERWTNDRVKKNLNLYITLTFPQWIGAMYQMFGRSCIMDSMQELVDEGLIKRQSYMLSGHKSYKYLLNISEINKRLAFLMPPEPHEPHDPDSEEQYNAIRQTSQAPYQKTKSQTKSVAYESYTAYLQSPEWKARRQKALRFANFKCQVCNSPENLNVHHRTYERLGHEHMGDLITLCKNCHEIFHNNGELSTEGNE